MIEMSVHSIIILFYSALHCKYCPQQTTRYRVSFELNYFKMGEVKQMNLFFKVIEKGTVNYNKNVGILYI